jgi:hypothetical protein
VIFGNWTVCPLSAEYLQSVIRIEELKILLSEVLSLKKKRVSFSAEVVIVHCFSIFIRVI